MWIDMVFFYIISHCFFLFWIPIRFITGQCSVFFSFLRYHFLLVPSYQHIAGSKMPFQNRSHYTLSLSKDMTLIESCEFFMSSQQTSQHGDKFRYISVAQEGVRQYGNLGIIGAASMPIANVDINSVTCHLRRDHPLLTALTGIQTKLVEALRQRYRTIR
jgi:hypothetical protein